MKNMIANYENGNLIMAKEQAKRFSYRQIIRHCQDELGYDTDKAMGIADYLKGHISFQVHCTNQLNK